MAVRPFMVKERDKDSDPRAGTLELSELDPPLPLSILGTRRSNAPWRSRVRLTSTLQDNAGKTTLLYRLKVGSTSRFIASDLS